MFRPKAGYPLAILALILASACSSPTRKFDSLATSRGLSKIEARSTDFRHWIYNNDLSATPNLTKLYVFLDGDGTPWTRGGTQIAVDPTPRRPLALELLANTKDAAIYITRPCYNAEDDNNCPTTLWTSERYSSRVVNNMSEVVNHYAALHGKPKIVLIGYSGGGTLVRLMAEQIHQLAGVITIAANLDVASWTDLHGYEPLSGSLDPVYSKTLNVPAIHLQGLRDTNVPPTTLNAYRAAHPDETFLEFNDYDHVCCWRENWPQLLALLNASLAQ